MKKDLHDEIAKVAYSIYEKRGRTEGCHADDWFDAEKIVMAGHGKAAGEELITAKKKAASGQKEKGPKTVEKTPAAKEKKTAARKKMQ